MKKKLLPIIFVALVIIIVAIILIISSTKNKEFQNYEIIEISYSYGGGFGSIIDTSTKTFTFSPDGIVTLSNSYNSYIETLNISQIKYNELCNLIKDNFSLLDEKPKENDDILDGSSSGIQIKLKDGQIKDISGYMLENKKFKIIKNKIYEIIDSKSLKQYIDNIKKNDTSHSYDY